MAYIMPTIPRLFFCYVEPALITFGVYDCITNPHSTAARVLPAGVPISSYTPSVVDRASAIETATMLFGAGLLATGIAWLSKERAVVRWMVLTSALTDIPHFLGYLWVLGPEHFFNPSAWSTELSLWLGVPIFTMTMKYAYLFGLFGEDKVTPQDLVDRKIK